MYFRLLVISDSALLPLSATGSGRKATNSVVLWKEFRVSILCGITLAAANFVKLLLFDLNGQENAFMIALVISLTLVGTIIMAKLVGSSLPLLASKVGFDPAVMANPLISTVCDSLSLLIYFGVAKLILHL